MGNFHVTVDIGDLGNSRFETVEALVDTGSTYLMVPRPILERLGIRPVEQRTFRLADGRSIERDVGQVALRLDGRILPVLCVFGDPASGAQLGAVALETFSLAPDPVARRLIPVEGLLMSRAS